MSKRKKKKKKKQLDGLNPLSRKRTLESPFNRSGTSNPVHMYCVESPVLFAAHTKHTEVAKKMRFPKSVNVTLELADHFCKHFNSRHTQVP